MGGGWGSGGAIVFPPWPSGGLYRVSAGGGRKPEPATALDASHDETAHRFPVFLPDGRHFLFFAVSSRPGESAIRVGSLDSTASKRLVRSDGAAIFAPDLASGRLQGYLLYLYDGNVMAHAFDPGRLALSGMPFQAVPNVAERLGRGDVSVSTSGIRAYRTAEPKNSQFAWLDRDGRLVRTVGARNSFYAWSLSADEKRIAIQDELRRASIWVMDVDRGNLSLLAAGPRSGFFPTWSSAGDEILLTSNYSPQSGGELEGEIKRQALTSTAASVVLGGPGPKFVSDWSPDGRWIAYFTPWPGWNRTNTHIVRVADAGKKLDSWRFASGSHSISGACFSPDSDHDPRWVAYTSDETGRREVYVGDFPRGERKWVVSTGGGWQPQWRRDGRELFYADLKGNLMSVEVAPGLTFRPGIPRLLFRAGIQPPPGPPDPGPRNFAVNRNGTRFLVNQSIEDPQSSTVTLVAPWIPDTHK